MIQWRFPSNDHGENRGINDSGVATFRGTPLKSLAREICQNSLDAAREKTVVVEFNVFSIPTENVPGITYLRDVFDRCLDFWGMQRAITTKEFYTNAIEVAKRETCYFLRISDFNSMLIIPSLVYALTEVKESRSHLYDYEDYRWYRSLRKAAEKMNVAFDEESLANIDPFDLAQKLMDSPIPKAVNYLRGDNDEED